MDKIILINNNGEKIELEYTDLFTCIRLIGDKYIDFTKVIEFEHLEKHAVLKTNEGEIFELHMFELFVGESINYIKRIYL